MPDLHAGAIAEYARNARRSSCSRPCTRARRRRECAPGQRRARSAGRYRWPVRSHSGRRLRWRARRKSASAAFDAITVEGTLISPAMLARSPLREADEQTEADYGVPEGTDPTRRDRPLLPYRPGAIPELFASPSTVDRRRPSHSSRRCCAMSSASLTIMPRWPRSMTIALCRHPGGPGRARADRRCATLRRPRPRQRRTSTDGRRRSAASAVQDWLNADDGPLGLLLQRRALRLLRDNASLTRPAYIEADLRQMFEAEDFADFAALWLLVHASRFGPPGAPPTDCAWSAGARPAARRAWPRATACATASKRLCSRSATASSPTTRACATALRPASSAAGLLRPAPAPGLSPDLPAGGRRPRAASRARCPASGASSMPRAIPWRSARLCHPSRGLGPPSRPLGGLADHLSRHLPGRAATRLPALGGIFAPELMPRPRRARLSNRSLMEAIYRLAWLQGRRPARAGQLARHGDRRARLGL